MPERRRQARLPWVSMDARVKLKKGLLGSQWIDVDVVDYTRLGMGIITDSEIKPDSRIAVSLRLGTEVGDIIVDQVLAHVRHREEQGDGHFYGLEFEEDPGKGVEESLVRIEGILSRHQSLAEKVR